MFEYFVWSFIKSLLIQRIVYIWKWNIVKCLEHAGLLWTKHDPRDLLECNVDGGIPDLLWSTYTETGTTIHSNLWTSQVCAFVPTTQKYSRDYLDLCFHCCGLGQWLWKHFLPVGNLSLVSNVATHLQAVACCECFSHIKASQNAKGTFRCKVSGVYVPPPRCISLYNPCF